MDVIFNNTQPILKTMPYKNIPLILPNKSLVYEKNIARAKIWYITNKNQPWTQTNEM